MNIHIGIDAVEIRRFTHFHTYSHKQLTRLFSPEEIDYCLQHPAKRAERFAARFAAKEALYKALTQWLSKPPCAFFTLCSAAHIHNNPQPIFIIEWQRLNISQKNVQISITHTKELAFAQVLLF